MTVADATVAADFNQALDIERHFTAKVTFDLQVMLNILTQFADFGLGEVLYPGVGIHADFREHFLRSGQADARPISTRFSLGRSTPAMRAILSNTPPYNL